MGFLRKMECQKFLPFEWGTVETMRYASMALGLQDRGRDTAWRLVFVLSILLN